MCSDTTLAAANCSRNDPLLESIVHLSEFAETTCISFLTSAAIAQVHTAEGKVMWGVHIHCKLCSN